MAFIVSINGCDVLCDTAAQVLELTGKPVDKKPAPKPNPIAEAKLVPREELPPKLEVRPQVAVMSPETFYAKRKEAVLEAIKRHPDWKTARLVNYIGMDNYTFHHDARQLIEEKKIRRTSKGHYEVLDKQPS